MAEGLRRQRILLVRLSALGDIVHAIPAQQWLAERFPGAEIHWLTQPPYHDLLERVPGISRIWLADTAKWRTRPWTFVPAAADLARSLRSQRFDLALDFQGLLKSAFLARLAGPRMLVGFDRPALREPAAHWFYSRSVAPEPGERLHAIERNLWLAGHRTPQNGASPRVPLEIPERARTYVREQLRRRGVEIPPVLVNPGAGWETKLWPARNYGTLAAEIQQRLKIPVVLTWGPAEELLAQEAKTAAPIPLVTFPTSLVELAALLEESRLMVAGDTGPLHLAVALGLPTVAILGPTTPWRNGPYSQQDRVVKRFLPCSDCYKRTCDAFICMDIPVQDVFEAVVQRLQA